MHKLYTALMGSIALIGYGAGGPPSGMLNTDLPLPTMRIKTDNGDVVINTSDFDPATMTVADGETAPPAPAAPAPLATPPANPDPNAQVIPAAAAPAAPPPPLATPPATSPAATDADVTPVNERFVTKIDGKFFVTNKDGKTLGEDGKVAEGLDGFKTDADAKKSVNFTGTAA
jgi:hypothetical protein